MKLELHHLAPYLPYGLKGKDHNGEEMRFTPILLAHIQADRMGFTPILRPLSDLTKEIEHNGEKFVPWVKLKESYPDFPYSHNGHEALDYLDANPDVFGGLLITKYCTYSIVQQLHEWHFDTFSLIENGLAVDINTVEK